MNPAPVVVAVFLGVFCVAAQAKSTGDLIACLNTARKNSCFVNCESMLPLPLRQATSCAQEISDHMLSPMATCLNEKIGADKCYDITESLMNLGNSFKAGAEQPAGAAEYLEKHLAPYKNCVIGCIQVAGCNSDCTTAPTDDVVSKLTECAKSTFASSVNFSELANCKPPATTPSP